MPYRLRENVSYCSVDGSLIFLDLDRDRYFCLSNQLEKLFLAYLCSNGHPEVDVSGLVQRNILTLTIDAEPISVAPVIATPYLSAIEHRCPEPTLDTLTFLETLAIVCSTQLQLKAQHLNRIIASVTAARQRTTAHIPFASNERKTERLIRYARMFRRARQYVPIENSCLLDSIAMVKFLTRRQLPADLIFGVTHHPFAAHCWVQAGIWVLNDTVGNVTTHTPIRRI